MNGLLIACVAFFLVSCAQSDLSQQQGPFGHQKSGRKAPYIYCNVYLQDACFGVAAGDLLQMKLPIDFTLYEVALSGGVKAQIYYGTTPDIPRAVPGERAWQSADGSFRSFEIEQPDGSAISNYVFVPSHSKIGNVVHVRISGPISSANVSKSFMANFRPCLADGPSLHCRDSSLFERGTKDN